MFLALCQNEVLTYGIDEQPHRKNQLVLSSFLSKEKVRIREYDFKNGSNPAHFLKYL